MTLQKVAPITTELYLNATGSFDQMHAANQAMYDAELELCETDKDRIQILEKMLATARANEERRTAILAGAQGTGLDVLKAKADCLDAEILLHRANAKEVFPVPDRAGKRGQLD